MPMGEQAWATKTHMNGQYMTNGVAIRSHNARRPLNHNAIAKDTIHPQASQIDVWITYVEEMSFIWANRSHRGKPEANAITATAAEAIIHALGCFTESRS
jgi:hypothetical protein